MWTNENRGRYGRRDSAPTASPYSGFSSDASVKPALSELRFALWKRFAVERIVFDHGDRLDYHVIRLQEMLMLYESEIVGR
jgi:hypothetical protein